MSPSVSIITPCYNAADTLPGTVASILAQDFDDWELLLVDDCSGDATEAVARGFAERDGRVRYVRMVENGGAARARNRGIELARGRYIAFLDADDLWLPNKLSGQLAVMRERGWALTFTAYHKVDGEERQLGRVGVPGRVTYRQLLKTNYIGCSTAIYDSEVLGKVLMPDIRRRQDFGLWLRLLKRTPYAYGIDRAWTLYRVGEQSLSANKTRSAGYNWRLYREVERLSVSASLYYFAHYAVRGLLRSRLPNLARRLGWLS